MLNENDKFVFEKETGISGHIYLGLAKDPSALQKKKDKCKYYTFKS